MSLTEAQASMCLNMNGISEEGGWNNQLYTVHGPEFEFVMNNHGVIHSSSSTNPGYLVTAIRDIQVLSVRRMPECVVISWWRWTVKQLNPCKTYAGAVRWKTAPIQTTPIKRMLVYVSPKTVWNVNDVLLFLETLLLCVLLIIVVLFFSANRQLHGSYWQLGNNLNLVLLASLLEPRLLWIACLEAPQWMNRQVRWVFSQTRRQMSRNNQ